MDITLARKLDYGPGVSPQAASHVRYNSEHLENAAREEKPLVSAASQLDPHLYSDRREFECLAGEPIVDSLKVESILRSVDSPSACIQVKIQVPAETMLWSSAASIFSRVS